MENNKKKLSPLLFFIIGLIISGLLGLAVSQLLLSKSELHRISFLWEYTMFYYFITSVYIIWFNSLLNYNNHFILNLFKFLGISFLFSLPYFLIITNSIPIFTITIYLPALIMLLAGLFICFNAMYINPELGKYMPYISLFLIFIFILIYIATCLGMSNIVAFYLISSAILFCTLFLLKQAKEKA